MSTWDLVLKESGNGNGSEVEFVKIQKGTTKLRVMDKEPVVMWKHWIQNANNGKGMSAICLGKANCPVCKANAEAEKAGLKKKYSVSQSFAVNALIEIDGEKKVQILEKGKTLFKALHVIMSQMGDLKNYEVNITRTGDKMQDITYTAIPQFPPVALTQEEDTKYSAMCINLNEYYTPLTATEIETLMNGGGLMPKEDTTPDVDFSIE